MGRSGIITSLISIDGCLSKKCPKCNHMKPLSAYARDLSKTDMVTSWCKKCRASERRRRRSIGLKETQYIQDQNKSKAKSILRYAVENSLIIRPNKCDMCWKVCNPEGHHTDYSKPYQVYWLCKDCHAFVHSRTRDEIYNRIEEKYRR